MERKLQSVSREVSWETETVLQPYRLEGCRDITQVVQKPPKWETIQESVPFGGSWVAPSVEAKNVAP